MERLFELSTDLALFALVARHGGLSAASRATGVPKSRLSRRIMQLEAALGARLIERSSRRFALTGLGRQVLEHAEEVAANTAAAGELVAAQLAEPRGLVRVAAPIGIDRRLAEVLTPVLRVHPALRVQVLPENRPVDLIQEEIDIALRVRPGLEAEADFQVRALTRSTAFLVAAPALAATIAGPDPEALRAAPTLSRTNLGGEDRWLLQRTATGETRDLRHLPRFAAGSFEPLRRAALDGLGVALIPESLCAAELAAGLLARVLPEWREPERTLYLVHVSRRAILRSVRVVLDALVAGLADKPI